MRCLFWQGAAVERIQQAAGAADICERVISAAGREAPADRVLREELKRGGRVAPGLAKEITRSVFSYYRWKKWLAENRPVHQQAREAVAFADRYKIAPNSFRDSELVEKAVPGWVTGEMEVSASWARALQREPRLWLRARRDQGDALAEKLGHARTADPLKDAVEYLGETDLFQTPGFRNGEFEIQDISSQVVGRVCAPKEGETWWDACAGEGGKLLHLSDLMGNKGLIWGSDRAGWRLERLRLRAARARVFNYRTAIWGGGEKLPTRARFDGVLVDAPCSGLGTWQRNPHARWTTSPKDIRELAALQGQLLRNAAKSLKQGGRLIYSVCTLTRLETSEVVKTLETSYPELEPLPVANPLEPGQPAQHGLVISGHQQGGNGMFIAAWKRSVG